MEVATGTARIATAAPAAIEGATVAADAAQAAATGVEALNTATATTEVLGEAKAAEALTGATEIAEVAPEAKIAAERLEKGLETAVKEGAGPEKAMQEFMATTPTEAGDGGDVATEIKDIKSSGEAASKDTAGTPAEGTQQQGTGVKAETPVTPQAEKITALAQREIDKAVQPQMTEWEKSNPPPDQMKEPAKYKAWMEQRAATEKQYTVNEGVNHDMAQWEKQNPPPDKEKNPEAYAQWEKRRAEKEGQSRQSREQLYDQQRNERAEQQRGMSKEEFMRKAARLQELQTLAVDIATNIQTLSTSSHQTETLKAQLVRSREILNQVNAEITNLRAELQLDAAISKEGWKRVLLPMILMGVLMLAPMMSSAEQA